MPRRSSSSFERRMFSVFELRPSVLTGGCSSSKSTSPISPCLRRSTSSCCSLSASAYGTRPSWRSWIKKSFVSRGSTQMNANPTSPILRVDLHVVHRAEAVEHRLCQRGMRVYGEHQVFDCAFELHHSHTFGDQLGRQRADDVHAKDLAELRVADDFHKAVVLADDGRARISGEGELADLDLATKLFGFRFRQANAADLRMAIRRARDAVFADGLGGLAGDLGHRDDAAHRA